MYNRKEHETQSSDTKFNLLPRDPKTTYKQNFQNSTQGPKGTPYRTPKHKMMPRRNPEGTSRDKGLETKDPTPHGSIDTKVAIYYYTLVIPPGTEVATHRWPPRTILVGAHPPRKYRHRGGNLLLHPWDPTRHGSSDTEVATSYYTRGSPPSTEISTQRWQSITTPL